MRLTRITALATLALPLLAAPLVVEAQAPGKVWRIAYLGTTTSDSAARSLHAAFDTAMKQLGYVEGQNILIERRYLENQMDAADQTVQEMVRLNVDALVTWAIQLSAAAKRATSTIPVVFIAVRAPVERGLVASLARPGGNLTGLTTYPVETIDPKLFELARELVPQLSRVAVLRSSDDPPAAIANQENAARALGFKLTPIPFSNDKDASDAPAAVERSKAELLIAPDTALLYARRRDIVQFAAKRHLPVVYAFREAVEDGGLMALSTDLQELARQAARYVDKILRGAKPADLPVEQPTKFELVINLKTARALGLTIPPSVLARADEIIQ